MAAMNLSDEQVVEIRQAIENKTKTKNQIAAELGVGERSIRNLMTGFTYGHVLQGITAAKPNKAKLGAEGRQKIIDCYNKCHSMYKVSEETGVSRNTIAAILKDNKIEAVGRQSAFKPKRASVPRKSRSVYQPPVLNQTKQKALERMVKACWDNKEIAEMLDLPRRDVAVYVKNMQN